MPAEAARCADCNTPLGKTVQLSLTGIAAAERCHECKTKARIKLMLVCCPKVGDREFDALSEWEQDFLPSVRLQFDRKGTLTEAQYQALERIYDRG